MKQLVESGLPFLPGPVAQGDEETINKGMWILWKQVITKYFRNTQKTAKQPQGYLLSSYSSFVWLHLGKEREKKKDTVWLVSSSTWGLHRCMGPISASVASPFSFNLQGLLEDPECSKIGYGPQSPAWRVCLRGQLDLHQSHCRPARPLYCAPKIPHQAQLSWSWKQCHRCINLGHFVYFDNAVFLRWQCSDTSPPINLHLEAHEEQEWEQQQKNPNPAAFTEERGKVQRGNRKLMA